MKCFWGRQNSVFRHELYLELDLKRLNYKWFFNTFSGEISNLVMLTLQGKVVPQHFQKNTWIIPSSSGAVLYLLFQTVATQPIVDWHTVGAPQKTFVIVQTPWYLDPIRACVFSLVWLHWLCNILSIAFSSQFH